MFLTTSNEDTTSIANFVDELRGRIDKVKDVDAEVKVLAKKDRLRKKRVQYADSDLMGFIEETDE